MKNKLVDDARNNYGGWLEPRAQIFTHLWFVFETGKSREDLVRVFGSEHGQGEIRRIIIEMIQDGTVLPENIEGNIRLARYPTIVPNAEYWNTKANS